MVEEAAVSERDRSAIERIVRNLSEKRQGKITTYTVCFANCGGNSHCVLKAHLKDGRLVAIEPDDRYNPGLGREDRVLSD